ncbi:MAG: hypothetical protein AAGI69_20240 [Cyanobacteria bacterium P01_H01_bin.21]
MTCTCLIEFLGAIATHPIQITHNQKPGNPLKKIAWLDMLIEIALYQQRPAVTGMNQYSVGTVSALAPYQQRVTVTGMNQYSVGTIR